MLIDAKAQSIKALKRLRVGTPFIRPDKLFWRVAVDICAFFFFLFFFFVPLFSMWPWQLKTSVNTILVRGLHSLRWSHGQDSDSIVYIYNVLFLNSVAI